MSTTRRHDLIESNPGTRVCLPGNLAIVRGALEAGVQFFSCYPGTPSSEIGDTFARIAEDAEVRFEYSVNEKIALEVAFGASLTGARSMCGMKHLGLSYACDPASTIPYVGVEGGLVIVSAGDPSVITSPNEQDQRHFGPFLYYPVFDPATPNDAREMSRYAFEFSEATRLPVLLRPTTRVCHSSGMVELGPLPSRKNKIQFTKNPPRHVPLPENARRMRRELTKRFRRASELLETSDFFPRTFHGKHGIAASGVAYAYVAQVIQDLGLQQEVTLQQIGAYPIPEIVLRSFLESVDSVLVIEELTPFVEDLITLSAFRNQRQIPVLGKRSGHLPLEFEYSPDLIEDALRDYLQLERRERRSISVPALPQRPPVLCAGCPHRASFYMVKKVFGKKTVYCNDIGCYTLGYGEPLECCDVLLCMGSSITQASGIARMTGQRTVAFIGDSTFYHSGLPALVNAGKAKDDITVVILDNYITAMTGFQPSLTTSQDGPRSNVQPRSSGEPGSPPLSIEESVRGVGVEEIYSVDPFDEGEILDALRQAKSGSGVNVVICHAPCVVDHRRSTGSRKQAPCTIDQELCNACSLCIRLLGCPAIVVTDGQYLIDPELCDGCELCERACNHDAIQHLVSTRV